MTQIRPLKTADSKLRLLEEKLNVGTWVWDLATSELVWSYGLFRMLGCEPTSVVPSLDLFQSLVHPDDQWDFDNAVGLASDKRTQDRRFRIIRPDGTLRWLFSKAQPHHDRHGNTMILFGVIADVTQEEETRSALLAEERTNTALTGLLKGKVWRAYPNGKLIETADWTKLTGETAAQAHDWETLAAIHPEDRSSFRAAWKQAIDTRGEYVLTFRVRTVAGHYVHIANRAMPILGNHGRIEQWVGHSVMVEPSQLPQRTPVALCASQVRAARGFLNWSAQDLSNHSGVSFSTVRRMEASTTSVRPEAVAAVRTAFEAHGVLFVQNEGSLSIVLSDNRFYSGG